MSGRIKKRWGMLVPMILLGCGEGPVDPAMPDLQLAAEVGTTWNGVTFSFWVEPAEYEGTPGETYDEAVANLPVIYISAAGEGGPVTLWWRLGSGSPSSVIGGPVGPGAPLRVSWSDPIMAYPCPGEPSSYDQGPLVFTTTMTGWMTSDPAGTNPVVDDIVVAVRKTCRLLNTPPVADPNGPYSVSEGSTITLDGTGSYDPDGDALIYEWDLDSDGAYETTGPTPTFDATLKDGPALLTVELRVTDPDGDSDTGSTTVEIFNVAPSISAITAPTDPQPVGTSVGLSASFSDEGIPDTHTATIDWGDGTTTLASVTGGGASGTVTGSHTYSMAGVYTVRVTVTDDDGGATSQDYSSVVVYDPSAGFVTGGGWIHSPAGAYTADPLLSGKASFGFVARYRKGATVPGGNTQFAFKAGDLSFHSSAYDFLVVTQGGTNARFKGSGLINDSLAPTGAEYRFMIWAADDAPDTFRIKIWYEDGGEVVVYDNGTAQAIGAGNIVIHAK